MQTAGRDPRFGDVDETTAALLRFPGDRFAQLTASQGSQDVDAYRIVGTEGDLLVEPAYTYSGVRKHYLSIGGDTTVESFPDVDQFAPELMHFTACILEDSEPEPSGEEGLADVRVLEAIAESARTARPVALAPFARARRPSLELEESAPRTERSARVVRAPSPSR